MALTGAQSTGVLHGSFQSQVTFFLTRVVMDNAATESGLLIGVQVMAAQLTASNAANGVDKVQAEEIFELVLVRVVGVRTTIEIVCRRIFSTLLITSVL